MSPHADNTGFSLQQPTNVGSASSSAQLPNSQYSAGMTPPPMGQSGDSSQAAANSTSSVPGTDNSMSDNADALDEQWVDKAKAIVEQTKADPFMESNELNKAKADYLRIRYNKQIKVNEDQR